MRAGELATIRKAVAKYVGSAAVPFLLLGDFNSAPHSNVFTGHVGTAEPIATGFGADGTFHWIAADATELVLRDAFADEHKGGKAVATRRRSVTAVDGLRCTSVNADRINWIDYVWYSGLQPMSLSSTAVPATQLPSPEHPSDHLPLAVTFRLDDAAPPVPPAPPLTPGEIKDGSSFLSVVALEAWLRQSEGYVKDRLRPSATWVGDLFDELRDGRSTLEVDEVGRVRRRVRAVKVRVPSHLPSVPRMLSSHMHMHMHRPVAR